MHLYKKVRDRERERERERDSCQINHFKFLNDLVYKLSKI